MAKGKKTPIEIVDRVVSLATEGFAQRQIANQLDIGLTTVGRILCTGRQTSNPWPPLVLNNQIETEQIRPLLEEGEEMTATQRPQIESDQKSADDTERLAEQVGELKAQVEELKRAVAELENPSQLDQKDAEAPDQRWKLTAIAALMAI